MIKAATTNGVLVDIYRNRKTKKAMIRYGYVEIGLSDTEALRLGSTLANTMSVNYGMFPNFMNGCGFYDNDENPTRLVLMINIGKVTADDYLMSIWSDEDMATKLFGIDVNRIRKWIDILYDVEFPKNPPKEAKTAVKEIELKDVDLSRLTKINPDVNGIGQVTAGGTVLSAKQKEVVKKLCELYEAGKTKPDMDDVLNGIDAVYRAWSNITHID